MVLWRKITVYGVLSQIWLPTGANFFKCSHANFYVFLHVCSLFWCIVHCTTWKAKNIDTNICWLQSTTLFFSRKVSTFADWLKVLTFGYLRIILSGIFSCKPFKSVHNNIQSFKHGKNFRGQFNKWNYSQTSDWQPASILPKALDSEWSCVHCRNGKVRWKSNLEVDKVSGGCRQPLESPTTPNVILANHLLAASTEKQYWSE